MKKMITIFCVVALFCGLLVPAYAYAAVNGCGHNSYKTDGYTDPNSRYQVSYSHQYKRGDGVNGPIYGTCTVVQSRVIRYPQCTFCGDVDYSRPHDCFMHNEHHDCGLGIVFY